MQTFINDVLDHLNQNELTISELTFILPSKRAGVFLLDQLKKDSTQTQFAPAILSIEEFVEELSQLTILSNTALLFEFYSIYKDTYVGEIESFDKFSKWAGVLLQDFNEIDRHIIDEHKIFSYLKAIQEINSKHWSLENQNSSIISNYLKFWNSLENLYTHFKNHLLEKKLGYQGLIYREAFNNIELYIQEHSEKQLVFLGFNALNTAETKIIQELLHHDIARIFWDIDTTFIENSSHDAGLFIRQYKKWNYFKNNSFNWQHDHYKTKKNITVLGVPKQVGQAKYIGNLLLNLKTTKPQLNNTAVVLGDETLIFPILSSIPSAIKEVNITMGLPLSTVPLAAFFNQLIGIQKNKPKTYYYKDVLALLSDPIISLLFNSSKNDTQEIIKTINKTNLTHLTCEDIIKISASNSSILQLLFLSWQDDVSIALETITQLIFKLKFQLDINKSKNKLNLEYLYQFHSIFNSISQFNDTYKYINSITTFYAIYNEVLSSETLDFEGQPLKGLQIMGMLESRVLDFETVIISGVNEGILPAGKTNTSFIPFDVKLENGLPTFREKDAIYAYHFYHLIQRAKQVYILYNTEPDALNSGEKSRFISQLELENIHAITLKHIAPVTPKKTSLLFNIKKNNSILLDLKEIAKKGISPSALLAYIRNPLDFYYQRILGIYEHDSIEETVSANTLGTVIHNTLEDLYKPCIGKVLTVEQLKLMKPSIEKKVTRHFKNEYKDGNIYNGKNLIIFEIAKRYISNFINFEINTIKNGNIIKIRALEFESEIELIHPQLNFPVSLKGKIDRIDTYNGTTRIIDYKTGNVGPSDLVVVNWDSITTDYDKHSKSFQILFYGLILKKSEIVDFPCMAGIISLKKLSDGFMPFVIKESPRGKIIKSCIDSSVLNLFQDELINLLVELFDPNIDFKEKQV